MTGLFFGSFNPIHNGHLAIARYLLDNGYCDDIWFVVSPCNPFKISLDLLSEESRLSIVQAAIEGDKRMRACDVEFAMERPSYTFNTLEKLADLYPQVHFSLIIGGDNLRDFHLWRNYQQILEKYKIWVYPRPGVDILTPGHSSISLVNAPLSDISSTDIRRKVVSGVDISSEVPRQALDLIKKHYV